MGTFEKKQARPTNWANGRFQAPPVDARWDGRTLPPAASWEVEGWWVAHIGTEGDDFEIGGLRVWTCKWRDTGAEPIQLPHPEYRGQTHAYHVYEIEDRGVRTRFAAAELSYGVWAFYVPQGV